MSVHDSSSNAICGGLSRRPFYGWLAGGQSSSGGISNQMEDIPTLIAATSQLIATLKFCVIADDGEKKLNAIDTLNQGRHIVVISIQKCSRALIA